MIYKALCLHEDRGQFIDVQWVNVNGAGQLYNFECR